SEQRRGKAPESAHRYARNEDPQQPPIRHSRRPRGAGSMITASALASEGRCPVLGRAEDHPVVNCHCALMLAARMTFAHLSISHRIRSANSLAVLAIGSNPSAERRSRTSGSATIL